jgi:alpha-tubulin suppressor-like RCC1 family protein
MSCFVAKNGTLYSWGKGEHERPKFDDFIEYSTPFPMLEDKSIQFVAVGLSHVMCLDKYGRLYGWGEGKGGCLGLGDCKRRLSVCPISFFENKRCIDVAAGDRFSVVIAEILPEPGGRPAHIEDEDVKGFMKRKLTKVLVAK